jgi:hypothetical protein
VDERLWLTGTPRQLLAVVRRLHARLRRPIDERKLRFFALACCRLAWPALVDDRSKRAVDVAERALAGVAPAHAVAVAVAEANAARDAVGAAHERGPSTFAYGAMRAARTAARVVANGFDPSIFPRLRDSLLFCGAMHTRAEVEDLLRRFAHALRDIFGNPFRPVAFAPEWRTDTAVALARQMVEAYDFSAMPILADALQDAGCDSAAVLTHCRDTALAHARGCWVTDLLLTNP